MHSDGVHRQVSPWEYPKWRFSGQHVQLRTIEPGAYILSLNICTDFRAAGGVLLDTGRILSVTRLQVALIAHCLCS